MPERLYQNYKNEIVTVLQNKFKYKNVMEVPKIDKVVINMGLGEAVKDPKKIETAQKELSSITGQLPIITKAKKANASFKLREGMSVGLKEQFIFPEIEYDTVDTPRGMDITIVTSAKSDEEAKELLKNFNFPFVK